MTAATFLAAARATLDAEARALDALAAGLDASFAALVALLDGARERVVVTGMGKSGHVARKTAATLASTGVPALFLHPAEASHGDLGMMTARDVLWAFSWSGDTAELGAVLAYAKRLRAPIAGVTSRANSALAQAADAVFLLPAVAEAGSLALAPTVSTTLQIALGDAAAMALLEARGFTREAFHALHPGGALGAALAPLREIIKPAAVCPRDAPLGDVILQMSEGRMGCVVVVDAQGATCGVITDGDLRRNMNADLLERRAEEVMSADPHVVSPDMTAGEALRLMNARAITSLIALDPADARRRPLGVAHIHDLLRVASA